MLKFNNPDRAVAIEYGQVSPRVLSVARGELVEKMLKIAEKKGITIYRDKDLTEVLAILNPGDKIPESLFSAVAAVMAYCYNVNDKFREKIMESE
jgi:flagellar biosynthesis protein